MDVLPAFARLGPFQTLVVHRNPLYRLDVPFGYRPASMEPLLRSQIRVDVLEPPRFLRSVHQLSYSLQ